MNGAKDQFAVPKHLQQRNVIHVYFFHIQLRSLLDWLVTASFWYVPLDKLKVATG